MMRISIKRLRPGMIIGKCIFSSDGQFLLGNDVVLNTNYINRLRKIGIDSIYVKSSLQEEVAIPETVSEETRQQSLIAVKKALNSVQLNEKININEMRTMAKAIVDEVILNGRTLVHLNDIRTHDDYTFSHSVNVCILATVLGLGLGYNEARLRELALGGLLHDLGKMIVPAEILNKPGKLTNDEMVVVQRHSESGFEILRHQHDMPLLASHIAFQHHEKFDGSGYPRGLAKDEIHEYARIVAIADVYDALISDRSYRPGMLPHQAYEILHASANTHFDEEILRVFFKYIAIYPIGTLVQLNNEQIGIVTEIFPNLQARPVVTIIIDKYGNLVKPNEVVNLTEQLSLFISKVIDEEELFKLDKSFLSKLILTK
ncbi:MAG: HD-GYP domain-containing protein [Pelosinus sp.]|nr:HD-GYP domain-containing protein [Pelosinus sp.]